MADPENYQYDIDVSEGRVMSSAVLLLVLGYLTLPLMIYCDREASKFDGEYQTLVKVVGLFTILLWISVFQPLLLLRLFSRFESRRLGKFLNKVLNGMRAMFGGHDVR